jgi:two-component system, NtrC family, sensor kinase
MAAPLEEMKSAVAAMEEGRFDVLIHETSHDEIGSVAEALRRAQGALERRVRQATVGLLAQRIGHDMRQNLGAIRMRAETLKRRIPPGDPDAAKALAAISSEVDRGADYLEELLMFGRERPPNLRPWDVNLILKEAAERTVFRPGVKAVLELSEGLPPCRIDEGEMRRALANVINNAHEAIKEAGEVRLSTTRVDGRVEVSVSDTGCGIPPEQKGRIFEDFFSTKSSGTGLGMGIVKKVMERHGGAVSLESEVGKGTRIVLSFPAGGAS